MNSRDELVLVLAVVLALQPQDEHGTPNPFSCGWWLFTEQGNPKEDKDERRTNDSTH